MIVRELHCSGGPTKLYTEMACTKRIGNNIARRAIPPGLHLDQLELRGSRGSYACNSLVRKRFVYHWPLPNIGYDAAWFMHRSCACNHYNALFGRVGLPVPRAIFTRDEVAPALDELVGQLGRCWNVPYRDIVAQYSGRKRLRYLGAEAELLRRGDELREEDARVNMFIKQEAIGFKATKPEPDCRAIQFRSFEYTLYLASRIRMCEKRLFKLADVPGMGPGPLFAKGMTDQECASALRSKYDTLGGRGVKIYGFDISRCDAHISVPLLRLEQEVYLRANPDEGLANALRMQLKNRGRFGCYTDAGYYSSRYTVTGERMSGDSNTSSGTCIIIAVILATFGVRYYPNNFGFLCNGDDSSFMFKGEWLDESAIDSFFRSFGLTVKVELKTELFEDIEFCQSKPVFLHSGWSMVRNPERVATRLGITNKSMSLGQRARYVRTAALGELSRLRGCPVLQPFLLRVIRDCEETMKCTGTKKKLDLRAVNESYRLTSYLPGDWMRGGIDPITPQARQGYELSWGVPPHIQLQIEHSLLRGCSPTGERCGRSITSLFPDYWTFDWDRSEIYNASL